MVVMSYAFRLNGNPFAARPQTDDAPRSPAAQGREAPKPDPATLPNVFDALEQQLGLRLESRKLPVEVYVIERVERAREN